MSALRSRRLLSASRGFRIIILFAAAASIAGCASDPEDREFFNRGWINPHREIDLPPAPKRAFPNSEPVGTFKKDPLVD